MPISLPLPEWVRVVRMHDVDSATQQLTDLLVDSQERGRVGRGELESAASQVVDEAFRQGVRLLGLVHPPGRPAALLSGMGLDLDTPLDGQVGAMMSAHLADRGGPGIDGLRAVDTGDALRGNDSGSDSGGVGTVVTLHRSDASGAQAQVLLAEPDGEHWYLLTLAGQDGDRGAELQQVLLDLVRGATVA